MEFIVYIPKMFSIDIEQFKKYLIMSGWKRDTEFFDAKIRFSPMKHHNIQIILPASENTDFVDSGHMMRIAVETLSQYYDEGIERVIESINDA